MKGAQKRKPKTASLELPLKEEAESEAPACLAPSASAHEEIGYSPIPSTGRYPRVGGTDPVAHKGPRYHAKGQLICARCGGTPAPLQRCMMVLQRMLPDNPDYPSSQTELGSYVLCDVCAYTFAHCLERSTRLTPIFLPDGPAYDGQCIATLPEE